MKGNTPSRAQHRVHVPLLPKMPSCRMLSPRSSWLEQLLPLREQQLQQQVLTQMSHSPQNNSSSVVAMVAVQKYTLQGKILREREV